MIFRPKRSPVLTRGRAAHLLIGFAVPAGSWLAWGYEGQAWATIAVAIGGSAWEAGSTLLAERFGWAHRYGDIVDLCAFLLGALIAAGVTL